MPRCEPLSTRRSGVWPARETRGSVFAAGSVLIELVQYLDPVGPAAPGGYRISDQGILNIAFGARSQARTRQALPPRARGRARGQNRRPLHLPGAGVVYVNDPDRFSVELLWMARRSGSKLGLHAPARVQAGRAPTRTRSSGRCGSPRPTQTAWNAIAEHETHDRVDRPRLGPPDRRGSAGA